MKRLLLTAVAALALNGLGATYYVDSENGTDDAEHGVAEGSGAWKTLAYALASPLVGANDEIVLAPGDHDFSGTMTVDKAVTIRGTGAPTETTIRGGNRFVVSVAGAFVHSLRLDNIMVGQTSSIELSGNSTISNAVISHVGGSNGSACGLAQSAGLLTHVAITNCPSIGFMWGGLVSLTGSAVMEDCVVADNVVSKGNAVKVNGTGVIVRNCTIVRNTLQVAGSAALGMAQAGKVYNTIIWGNTDGTATANWSGSTANWDTNCTYPLTGVTDPNTIGEGPNFQSDGLHPKFTSPCNHKGNPELATTTDIEGNVRGDKPSIGAYEYVDRGELEVSATASASFVRAPDEIVLTPTVIGSYVGQLSYAWDLNGDGDPEETTPTVTLSEVGSYQPTLVVHDEGSGLGSYTFGAPIAIHVEGKGTCYVDYAGGSDANNGLTDQTPWKNLAFALASPMVVDGDEIVLAKGSHSFSGTMTVDKAVTIRGTGAPTETVFGNGERLDVSAEGAFIHSLSLVNIHRSGFDSISLSGDSTISNAVISNVGGEGSVSGLGLAAGLLTHSAVTNSPGVSRMWNGLVSISGTGAMEDCLVADNEVTDGNAVRVSGSGAAVRNCTIVRNLQKSGSAALGMSAAGNVYNTIIWGNTDGTRTVNWSGDSENTKNWDTNCTYPLTGVADPNTIGDDPSFQSDGLHPKSSSPCNHTGNPELATATDFEGNLRGDQPSIGAYEYVDRGELEVSATASASFVRAPNEIVLTPTVIGSYVGQLSYAWDLDGDGEPEVTTERATLSEVGSYQPTLIVHDEGSGHGSYTFGSPLVVHAADRGMYYVDSVVGSDANDGLTDQTPWKSLAFALAAPSVVSNDVIVLAKGNYGITGTMTVDKAVTIRGTGAPTDTVICGGSQFVVSAHGALIHTLSFVDIHKSYGDSVSLTGNSVISNAVFSNVGGGNGSPSGVGLNLGLLTHSVITNCPAVQFMYHGLVSLRGKAKMENCLVVGNTMSLAGAVNIRNSDAIVRNCTIADNEMQTAGKAAMMMYSGGTVANTITWGNTDISSGSVTADWGVETGGSTTKWTANCTSVTNGLAGVKNIEADPLFSTKEPYHIARTSPCRNRGDDTLVAPGETDLAGNPRKKGRHVDIGCYEVDGPGMSVIVQ